MRGGKHALGAILPRLACAQRVRPRSVPLSLQLTHSLH